MHLLRIILLIPLVLVVSLTGLFAQVHEFIHPSILSFEEVVAPAMGSQGSILTISEQHFKHGKKSLHWTWSNEGDTWQIKQAIPYAAVNPYGDNSVATFVFWVYAPKAYTKGKLVVEFYKDNKLCSWFDYQLNFQGWSGAWVAFDRDMQGNALEGMDEMRMHVEGVATGELYFDHLMLASFQDVRHHTADLQAPFINAGTDNHWLTLLDSWNEAFDLPLPFEISAKQVADMQVIEKAFITTLTERTKPVNLHQLIKRYKAYQINYQPDGSVTGLPVFFERYGESYARIGAIRYNLLFDNPSGLRRLNKLMFDMAISYRKAVNLQEKETIANMFVDLSRHMLDQGFRAGSAMGTLHHLGYSMRMYYSSAFLMQDVLQNNQLNDQVQQAMEWFAGTGEVKTKPAVLGMDVDAFNTSLSGRLASILMMQDSPEKVRYLKAFTRWIDNGLQLSDGTAGTFKIDGTMFHHRRNYPAYAIGGLDGAVDIVWILHNTSFALPAIGRENLKEALLAMRYYCNLLNWPLALSGRHPDGEGQLIPKHFARLALSGTPDGKVSIDKELASAYLRLLHDSTTRDARDFKKMSIVPELSPQGNRAFPYGSLSVQRRNDWMATATGHSRYLWATETYVGANLYGRYLNHGHLQIMATGNPVSNVGSGFRQEGWDWNHFPGTTAAELPMKDLRADIKNLDEDSGYEELLLSDEAFAGPIAINNRNGAYAMKLHEHDKYNGSLRAHKSFFFFDNRVVALGSNVRSMLPDNEVHTTLFQVYQSNEQQPISLNGKQIKGFPYAKTITSKHLSELSDGLNNYYFVNNAEVQIKCTEQHSLDEETDAPTHNPFALAYINHGKKAFKDQYEYFILIQPDANTLKSTRKTIRTANKAPYQILQQDSMAHIVYDVASKTTAYIFFEAGTYADKHGSIQVNIPCMVMSERLPSGEVRLSVSDPDLRFYEGPADEQYDEQGKRIERSVYSRNWINNPSHASEVELTLSGNWQLTEASDYMQVKSQQKDQTHITINCRHGLSREAVLKR